MHRVPRVQWLRAGVWKVECLGSNLSTDRFQGGHPNFPPVDLHCGQLRSNRTDKLAGGLEPVIVIVDLGEVTVCRTLCTGHTFTLLNPYF